MHITRTKISRNTELCLRQARLAGGGIMFATCPSVRPFVCYQHSEHDILTTHETTLMPTGTSGHSTGQRHEMMINYGLRSRGQRSRLHEAEDWFGGLAEASFSAPFRRAAFLVFAARCYASAVLAVMRCLCVCPSVTLVDHVNRNKHIFKFFSPSGSYTILVFFTQTAWRYSDGNPLNGGVECRWGRQKLRFCAYIWLVASRPADCG